MRVEVVEAVAGGNWYRVARDGKALGFVYAPLLQAASD
jgi:hypothetical protein